MKLGELPWSKLMLRIAPTHPTFGGNILNMEKIVQNNPPHFLQLCKHIYTLFSRVVETFSSANFR